ncbi:hypothetical protein [Paenibacillus tyrfis]|uniref:hypothetical protein n=1 Tax=Paenibacillus tyrfis TaxID=1501230 RepID=UPI0012699AB4|nr:hypothetical protein [Paenibacillus tyrfis]
MNRAISRISGALDSIDNGNYSGYLLAIEHASKANALSQFSSYPPEANLTGITAELINEFRNLNIKQKKLADKEELMTLFQKLSSDPTNREISERIIKLLQKN